MAAAADIPPELFELILSYICNTNYPLHLEALRPNEKEIVKAIATCSLTCVYWARFCRKRLFDTTLEIKSYDDLREFSLLVSRTPKRFTPISEYVYGAILVQRVEERPWIHLLRLQPSLFPFRKPGIFIYFRVVYPSDDAATPQRQTRRRLFANLPRTPPPSCLHCLNVTFDKPHFAAPRDLVSLINKFIHAEGVSLDSITWDAKSRFESDLLTGDPLCISSSNARIRVYGLQYTAEAAWLALATYHRYSPRPDPTIRSAIQDDRLNVLPSAQRAIVDILKSLCWRQGPTVVLSRANYFGEPDLEYICTVEIIEHESSSDHPLHLLQLLLFGPPVGARPDHRHSSTPGVVDRISMIYVWLTPSRDAAVSKYGVHGWMRHLTTYPWEEIVGICAAQEDFARLQLNFDSYGHLIEFMEAQRAALAKLEGRIHLFYTDEDGDLRMVDYESLADLGDGDEHAYIGGRCAT